MRSTESLARISRCDVKIKSVLIKALRALFRQHLGHPRLLKEAAMAMT